MKKDGFYSSGEFAKMAAYYRKKHFAIMMPTIF